MTPLFRHKEGDASSTLARSTANQNVGSTDLGNTANNFNANSSAVTSREMSAPDDKQSWPTDNAVSCNGIPNVKSEAKYKKLQQQSQIATLRKSVGNQGQEEVKIYSDLREPVTAMITPAIGSKGYLERRRQRAEHGEATVRRLGYEQEKINTL